MPVPLFDTETPLADLRPTILERVNAVIQGGRFILGPEVKAFEQELARYVGVAHAIGVANGTDALTIAARALGVEPGDEVVVPVLHLLCHRGGDRGDGRDARLLRHRP